MARTRWPPGPVKPRPLTQARQIRPAAPVGALKRGPADRSFRRTARAGVSRIAGQAGPVPDPTPEPGQTLGSRAGSTIHTLPAEYALLFDGQFAAVTPHRTASSVVRQRRWRVAVDRRLAERLLRGAGIEAPARCATCTERQSADPDRLTRGPQAGRRAGRAIRTLPGPVRCGPGGRGCRGRSGSVRAVAACLAVLVWPPAARRLARPGSRRSRLLRWTGPGSAGIRRPATMSTPGRSR